MDLRHLQTFKVIAEAGSFVQAAERLQYAQSTLTLQIQQLEAELGVELFDRQRRKIQLTAAGHTLLATYWLRVAFIIVMIWSWRKATLPTRHLFLPKRCMEVVLNRMRLAICLIGS